MSELDPDELLQIVVSAEPGGEFDQADEALRRAGRGDLADNLLKLQQDAGLELDPAFDAYDLANPPGPQTAELWRNYQLVTKIRYEGVINAVKAALRQSLQPPAP